MYIVCKQCGIPYLVQYNKVLLYCKLAWRWLFYQPKHVAKNKIKVALVTRIVVYWRKYLHKIVLCRTTAWPPLKKKNIIRSMQSRIKDEIGFCMANNKIWIRKYKFCLNLPREWRNLWNSIEQSIINWNKKWKQVSEN